MDIEWFFIADMHMMVSEPEKVIMLTLCVSSVILQYRTSFPCCYHIQKCVCSHIICFRYHSYYKCCYNTDSRCKCTKCNIICYWAADLIWGVKVLHAHVYRVHAHSAYIAVSCSSHMTCYCQTCITWPQK